MARWAAGRTRVDEEAQDQVPGGDVRLAHEVAQRRRAAQTRMRVWGKATRPEGVHGRGRGRVPHGPSHEAGAQGSRSGASAAATAEATAARRGARAGRRWTGPCRSGRRRARAGWAEREGALIVRSRRRAPDRRAARHEGEEGDRQRENDRQQRRRADLRARPPTATPSAPKAARRGPARRAVAAPGPATVDEEDRTATQQAPRTKPHSAEARLLGDERRRRRGRGRRARRRAPPVEASIPPASSRQTIMTRTSR
jgi:hypothetical protein